MNEKLAERLKRIAEANHSGDVAEGRTIEFAVCCVCGYARWCSSSEPGKGFAVVALDDNPNGCPRCAEVAHRSPEVFRWVLGVMAHAEMLRHGEESKVE